jgi:hypothetical protein
MAYRVNGIGTWPCKAGYDVGWGADDAVECFTLFYLPLIPLKSMHILAEKEALLMTRTQAMPIRWSNGLVGQVLLRIWSRALLFFGIFFVPLGALTLAFASPHDQPGFRAQFFYFVCLPPFVLGLAGCLWARGRARRTRRIRLLLGPHALGTSDPASWLEETVSRAVTSPKEMLGAETFAQASELFLSRNDFRRAMWAARLSTACENPPRGERLTDQVLQHPGASEALEQARPKIPFWQRPL